MRSRSDQDQGLEDLFEAQLARVANAPTAAQRAELLRELSWSFENELRDPERALVALLAAYRELPRRDAWTHLERLAAAADGWSELVAELAAALPALPVEDHAVAWTRIGTLYEKRLDHADAALECYRRAVAVDPDSPEARLRLEALLRARGAWEELVRVLEERCDRAAPIEQRAIRLELAGMHAQLGDRAGAIARYEELRQLVPGDLRVLRALEKLYEEDRRIPELLDVLKAQAGAITGARDLAALHRRMATEWEQQLGDRARAEECLEWVIHFLPTDESAYRDLARLYRADNNWAAAVDVLCRHAAIAPPAERAELHAEVARIYERQLHDAAGALEFYRKVEADRPQMVDAMSAPIRLYERTEDYGQVVTLLERRAAKAQGRERAELLHRAAGLCRTQLADPMRAAGQLADAVDADPTFVPAMVELAELHRASGKLRSAQKLLEAAVPRAQGRAERARLTFLQGQLAESLADVRGAVKRYVDVLGLDPDHYEAASRLAELLGGGDDPEALRPALEVLAVREPELERRVARLLQLATVEEQLGDVERAHTAFARAIALDPTRAATLLAHGELLVREQRFTDAYAMLLRAVDHASVLPLATQVELHHQLGACARALGKPEARDHFAAALGLDPEHRASRRAQLELDRDRPAALVDHYRMLARSATPVEQAALLAAVGDLYAGPLGDPDEALTAYRQALALKPDDPRLLHRCLDVCEARQAWDEMLPLLDKLSLLERDGKVRARYRQAAGLVLYDELGRADEAVPLLQAALEADATLERAAQALEEIWSERGDWTSVANLHCARLQRLGPAAADDEQPVRARLWAKLGELCLDRLDDHAGALAALEVAARFDPSDLERQRLLATLFAQAPGRQADAAAAHQAIVAADPTALESFTALAELLQQGGHGARALAARASARFLEKRRSAQSALDLASFAVVEDAFASDQDAVDETPLPRAADTLPPELWTQLRHPDEDRQLSAVFATLTPFVLGAQAQTHKQLGLQPEDFLGPDDPRAVARVVREVARAGGMATPAAFVRYDQQAPVKVVSCLVDRELVPTLLLGRPLLGHRRSERQVAFHVARALSYFRPGRLLRLLVPHPARLARLVEVAMAVGVTEGPKLPADIASMVQQLESALAPAALDQLGQLGALLRDRRVRPEEAALSWLRATDLTAGRVALLLLGDLALCARLTEESEALPWAASPGERVLDLVAAHVHPAMFAARERLKLYPVPPAD